MLYLHGGGYAVGSAYGYRPLVGALVAAAGVGALVPDYRLAPEHPFPAALEDALSAYRWLAEQRGAATGSCSPATRVGGGLALLAAADAARARSCRCRRARCCCARGSTSPGELMAAADPDAARDDAPHVADAYLGGHPTDDPIVSPLLADLTGLPPLLVQAATGDLVLPESRRSSSARREHGVDARLELYPADTHVFHVFWSFLPEAADALQQAGALHPRAACEPARDGGVAALVTPRRPARRCASRARRPRAAGG